VPILAQISLLVIFFGLGTARAADNLIRMEEAELHRLNLRRLQFETPANEPPRKLEKLSIFLGISRFGPSEPPDLPNLASNPYLPKLTQTPYQPRRICRLRITTSKTSNRS
jgi:hypothetical protein